MNGLNTPLRSLGYNRISPCLLCGGFFSIFFQFFWFPFRHANTSQGSLFGVLAFWAMELGYGYLGSGISIFLHFPFLFTSRMIFTTDTWRGVLGQILFSSFHSACHSPLRKGGEFGLQLGSVQKDLRARNDERQNDMGY